MGRDSDADIQNLPITLAKDGGEKDPDTAGEAGRIGVYLHFSCQRLLMADVFDI